MPRFLTIDPAHFHAALVQKEMYDQVDRQAYVYAPLGNDLIAHLQRLIGFNTRSDKPTSWQVDVHARPDFLEQFEREKPGNIVVLAGRNARKIEYIERAIAAGHHVLADKPWILVPEHLPRLARALDEADKRGLIAYDIMTERHEITSILQRELIQDAAIFGRILPGSADEPAVYMESIHYLKKLVAGVPLRRPASYFDIDQQGEGLSDVGTHLVDLIPWMLFPAVPMDVTKDVRLVAASRWPTKLNREVFQQITGEADFPSSIRAHVQGGELSYYCNTMVLYTVRGVHVKFDVLWDLEAQPGSLDSHLAIFRGSRASIEIRGGKDENFRPEVYVVANSAGDKSAIRAALEKRLTILGKKYAGLGIKESGDRLQLAVPDVLRLGHEAHFAEVTRQFLRFLQKAEPMPAWEKPNMVAKYHVTTNGVALARSESQ